MTAPQRRAALPATGALYALCALCAVLAGCASGPPPADAVITGVALTRERTVLPQEAVFEASLLDVTAADEPPVVLGRQRQQPAGQAPFAIRIPYPAQRFAPKGRYEVRATVTLEGRLLWASDSRTMVPQDPAYRHVSLQLARAWPLRATADAGVPLLLTHWRLVEIDEEPVPAPSAGAPAAHLVFQGDAPRVTGSGGCNRFYADVAADGARLRFGRVVSNITLCLDRSAAEERFFSALGRVEDFQQRGTQLLMRDAERRPVLRFEAAETPLR